MKDQFKKALTATKKYVSDHRVGLAVTTTAIATAMLMGKLQGSMLQDAQDFIEAKGLTDEFIEYLPNTEN